MSQGMSPQNNNKPEAKKLHNMPQSQQNELDATFPQADGPAIPTSEESHSLGTSAALGSAGLGAYIPYGATLKVSNNADSLTESISTDHQVSSSEDLPQSTGESSESKTDTAGDRSIGSVAGLNSYFR